MNLITLKKILRYFIPLSLLTLVILIISYIANPSDNRCVSGNCIDGYGTYLYSSNKKYTGQWKNSKRHGKGILSYPDGTKYDGEWKNNRMDGVGTKTYNDRNIKKYSGSWKNGKKHGQGVLFFNNGSRFEGEWRDGKMHGKGTFFSVRSGVLKGHWINGSLTGEGIVTYPDGMVYIGKWNNDKRYGTGTFIYPDGSKLNIEWGKDKVQCSPYFFPIDFKIVYDIKKLCKAIQSDIDISLEAKENTVEWLNALLRVPNLYDIITAKKSSKDFSWLINNLAKVSSNYRNKQFYKLNNGTQEVILKLNRLLIEHFYPDMTPKLLWSEHFK